MWGALARADRGDRAFATSPVRLAGKHLVADHSGALWWPAERMLIVADLHLEKGSAHAVRGLMLPPYDTRDTLARLTSVVEAYAPRTVVALGDSLHDRGAAARLRKADRQMVHRLQLGRTWVWITGNHDPEIASFLGGEVMSGLGASGLELRHEPQPARGSHEIAGHLHPAARLTTRAQIVRRRCFVADGSRIVLPAFGTFAGGLNILDSAFEPLLEAADRRVWMLGDDGIYPVPPGRLVAD
ncbi:MAG: ligase-associated DNA damage response endonuclease PdeM [Hyphomicrobiaceae bacterium]|nr:ligase-associated DNA damage response endonuclease PdeM [Hyphomicrobiaceae bacterium]